MLSDVEEERIYHHQSLCAHSTSTARHTVVCSLEWRGVPQQARDVLRAAAVAQHELDGVLQVLAHEQWGSAVVPARPARQERRVQAAPRPGSQGDGRRESKAPQMPDRSLCSDYSHVDKC